MVESQFERPVFVKWKVVICVKEFEGSNDIGRCHHDGTISISSDFLYRYDVYERKIEEFNESDRGGFWARQYGFFVLNGTRHVHYNDMSSEQRFFTVLNHELFHAVYHKRFEALGKMVTCVFVSICVLTLFGSFLTGANVLMSILACVSSIYLGYYINGLLISLQEWIACSYTPEDVRDKSIDARLWNRANK